MEYKYNGKQLHATRLELLIALNYLLDNCPNEHKTSKTIELTKYAEEKFDGAFIDRRKANDIFDDLVEFTHTYPNIIPYTVNRIKNKPRYYVKKNLLNSRDIEKIASAIKDHGSLTEKASNQLIDRFLDKVTDEDKKTKIVQTLKKTPSLVKHQISDENMELIEKFEWLRDNTAMFFFKLNKKPKDDDVSSPFPFRGRRLDRNGKPVVVKEIYPGYYSGFVFEVCNTSKSTKVCIYLPDYKSAIITSINNVIFHETYNPFPYEGEISYEIGNSGRTVSDWFTSHFQGKNAPFFNQMVKFKFYVGHENEQLLNYKEKFEEIFKTPMEYTLQEREVELTYYNGEKETVIAQDAVVNVECCFAAFKKWYWESQAFEAVVVLEPAIWNDRLLEHIVERFSRRLTKYGARNNYQLNKTMKPEYEAVLKERHERFMRMREERRKREQTTSS